MSIEVKLKNLKSEVKSIHVNPEDTIESKLEDICKEYDYSGIEKLVYAGKVLDFSKTFEQYNIVDQSMLIVMKKNKPSVPVAPSVPVNVPSVPVAPSAAVSAGAPVSDENTHDDSSDNESVEETVTERNETSYSVPPRGTMSHDWINAPHSDFVPSFSIEQVHASLTMMMTVILQNPIMSQVLVENPEDFGNQLADMKIRTVLRQLLGQSSGIVHAIRSGLNSGASISFQGIPIARNVGNDDSGESEGSDDETTTTTIGITRIPIVAEPVATQISATQTTSAVQLTDHDNLMINQLIELVPVPIEMARQVYLQCSKNIDIAADILMRMFEGSR